MRPASVYALANKITLGETLMLIVRRNVLAALACAACLNAPALAQPYPSKPIHLIVPYPAGGIKLNEIPYRGAAPAVQDLLAGTVPLMFVDYATARSHIAAGTLKALGVAALEERKELPGVPPVAATPGLAGFEAWPWQGIVAPAKTPPEVITKLRDTYIAAVNDAVVRQKLIEAGLEPLQSSPQEFADYRRREAAKWAEV